MTLTKEWLLKTIAELEEERDAIPGAVNEDAATALAAMKMALGALEAGLGVWRAIYHGEVVDDVSGATLSDVEAYAKKFGWESALTEIIPPYNLPQPVPVSVPLAIHDEDFEKALSVLNDTLDDCGDSERGLLLALDKVGIEVRSDACRAAMLQGAAGNSPAIPDGYALVPVELTGAMTNAMTDAILDDLHNVDVWRSVLSAAPQQEAK